MVGPTGCVGHGQGCGDNKIEVEDRHLPFHLLIHASRRGERRTRLQKRILTFGIRIRLSMGFFSKANDAKNSRKTKEIY